MVSLSKRELGFPLSKRDVDVYQHVGKVLLSAWDLSTGRGAEHQSKDLRVLFVCNLKPLTQTGSADDEYAQSDVMM